MSAAPPPPPPPTAPLTPPGDTTAAATGSQPAFIVKGETADDATFEFKDVKDAQLSVRTIVSRYLGSPQSRLFAADKLHMILGRLRCLHHSVEQYNRGLADGSPSFLGYWRRHTLDQLSGFGFQVTHASQAIRIAGLAELVARLEELFADQIAAQREMIRNGFITFDALGELYRPGIPLQGRTSLGGTPGVFMLVESYYEERRSLVGMEKSFHFTLEFVASVGEHFTVVRFTEVLSGWTGVRSRPINELTYTPLSSDDFDTIRQRGENYVRFAGAKGSQYLGYGPYTFFLHGSTGRASGSTAKLASTGGSQLTKGGRVVLDVVRGAQLGHHASQGGDEPTLALVQMAGRYRRWRNTHSGAGSAGGAASGGGAEPMTLWDTVPDDFLLYCWPALVGFSFTAKGWGHVLVSGLEPIKFHDQAFDQLVLAPERKQLIRALVRFGGEENTEDIVGGKRGGSIFLLHGPPGVGKTLTAEAISEVLRRPLYYVSMGELGTTPEEMETRLGDVLELCAGWNALTLLDEADVFLETRTSADLVRSAMVCVMLKLLEYHPGILFLTTNRVKSFDPAFESRVTVALRYENLDPAARCQIWRNLLAKVTGVEVATDIRVEELGKHALNGRQIKNAVRLAVALAREREASVTHDILETTLGITNIGREEMLADDSWKGT
ncbi:hypothetical protein HDU96_009182 [Phlyctochytrium bullatum]|nr:hypothetical protein HDU96_009182 [Phlyctochytrium bullatum]